MRPLNRAVFDGIELEYEVRGAGEPVVLVHAGIFADWFKPLLQEPTLTGRYRIVSYHRIGYAGSSRVAGPISIAQQAAHLRSLMRHLRIERAHIIGHSSGGNIALQLALDAPDVVQSLVLMEPALPVTAGGAERMLATRAAMAPVFEAFHAGDKARAIDLFMRGVAGPAYRATLEQALPGAFDQAIADANTFFGQELPAVQQWSLKRRQVASPSRCWPLSGREAKTCPRSGVNDRKCCLTGCQRPRVLSLQVRRTCFTCRIRRAWLRVSLPSSPVIESLRGRADRSERLPRYDAVVVPFSL